MPSYQARQVPALELVSLAEADVSESEGRVIRNVVFLRPGVTVDKKRRYPEAVVSEASPLFSSTRLWRGHGSVDERKGLKERDPLDVLGVAAEAKVDPSRGGALVGINRFVEGHPVADGMWALLKDPATRALMHVSWEGQALQSMEEAEGSRRARVDRIVYVHGLAIVSEANAGGAYEAYIREAAERTMRDMDITTVEQLREAFPALVAELLHREQEGKAPPGTAIVTAESMADVIEKAVNAAVSRIEEAGLQEQRRVQVQGIIKDSGLVAEAAEVAFSLVDMKAEDVLASCREAVAKVQKISPAAKTEPDGSAAGTEGDSEDTAKFESIMGQMFGLPTTKTDEAGGEK